MQSERAARPSTALRAPLLRLRRLSWALLLWMALLLPLFAGLWVLLSRVAEERTLTRAAVQLQQGELEAAIGTLEPLQKRRVLSGRARRRAAELLFRLGEDRTGHALLLGQPFDSSDVEDLRLRTLTSRNLRAAALLRRAEQAKATAERVRLVRAARLELPESPRLLQRQVQEGLLAMTQSGDPRYAEAFERSYAELRRKAPTLAAEVKQSVTRALQQGAGEGSLRSN